MQEVIDQSIKNIDKIEAYLKESIASNSWLTLFL